LYGSLKSGQVLPESQLERIYKHEEDLTGAVVAYTSAAVVFLLLGMGILTAGLRRDPPQDEPPPAGQP
jgi:hypothetical protein